MGRYEPRTAAAELTAEATAARVAAAHEEENLLALRAAAADASAEDAGALAFQVRRSERIVEALRAEAAEKDCEAARIQAQVSSVS